MAAKFPYYLLADSEAGIAKGAQLRGNARVLTDKLRRALRAPARARSRSR